MIDVDDLPAPTCKYGYTGKDLCRIFDDLPSFNRWMYGQTMTVCTGMKYDPEVCMMVPDVGKCHNVGGHGTVVYQWDVARYILGLPIVD